MKITLGERAIATRCTGCPCHWDIRIQMGPKLIDDCCGECGCPKTEAAFNKVWDSVVQSHTNTKGKKNV